MISGCIRFPSVVGGDGCRPDATVRAAIRAAIGLLAQQTRLACLNVSRGPCRGALRRTRAKDGSSPSPGGSSVQPSAEDPDDLAHVRDVVRVRTFVEIPAQRPDSLAVAAHAPEQKATIATMLRVRGLEDQEQV